ncbi:MAG: hypothetical protein AB4042_15705 [Leptolyngbyaceae cyanobacterium]
MATPVKLSIPFESLVEAILLPEWRCAIAGLTLENKLQLRQILDQQIDGSQPHTTKREQELAILREKIDVGTQQIQQGQMVDGETVFQQLNHKIQQLEQD